MCSHSRALRWSTQHMNQKSEHKTRLYLFDFKCNYSKSTDYWAMTNSSLVGFLLVSQML
ncbi:hypothetical protein VAEKB19_3770001 [Vibrio aestuarianus]|nr:hypothetical protein VAEKB19_3770001 [Vibrio aestuarianus]